MEQGDNVFGLGSEHVGLERVDAEVAQSHRWFLFLRVETQNGIKLSSVLEASFPQLKVRAERIDVMLKAHVMSREMVDLLEAPRFSK